MRALVICDDFYHPASIVHSGLDVLGDDAFELDWIEDAREWSADRMASYPLVLLVKSDNVSTSDRSSWVTDDVERAFQSFVRKGSGLLVIHSGSAGYAEKPVLRGLMGGVFTHHPPQCMVTVEPVSDHPLTAGVSAFMIRDEHYHMALDDAEADVFMTTVSEHGAQPGGWTRAEGQGRVCMLTPGHNVEVWLHPSFQTLLLNAMRWCARLM